MEMTVNQAITIIKRDDSDMKHGYFCVNDFRAIETLVDCGKKYQLMQLEYNARLRADMVAMLTEIQLEIEEIYKNWCYPTYFNATDAMNKLGEVLKDGKID